MNWQTHLNCDPLPWLLDPGDPGVRYLALRDLLDCPPEDAEYQAAVQTAHWEGPIHTVLGAMEADGYWVEPGPGYNPKFFSTVWAVILLAQLGASADQDERIPRACAYLLKHALAEGGQFTMTGAPSGTVDCLQGNLCWALLALGYDDPQLVAAFDWMARTVTGEGLAPASDRRAARRYYAGKCGLNFACGANNRLPCAWGAAKVMLAFSLLPPERRPPQIEAAIRQGVDFLFSVDPATADYPHGTSDKPSGNWWKFGFPVFYVADLLHIVEALASLGCGRDPRLQHAWQVVLAKQDANGRWPLEYNYAGKTWIDFGPKKQPNKWVTLRALRALKTTYGN
jgi:hypothetical protein